MGQGYRSSSHACAPVNGTLASIPAPVITIAKVRRVSIASSCPPRGGWTYTAPPQWRRIGANGACSRNPGAEMLAVPRISAYSGRRAGSVFDVASRNAGHRYHAALAGSAGRPAREPLPSTQVLADKILERANWIFGATGTRLAFRGFPFCGDLGLFLFRRLFRDHHGPVRLVAGLLVAGYCNPYT